MKVESGLMIPTMQFGPDDVFLYEEWRESPAGAFRALFHYSKDDVRTLYADSQAGLDLVPVIHRFDRRVLSRIKADWSAGRLALEVRNDSEDVDLEVEFKANLLLRSMNFALKFTPGFLMLNPLVQAVAPKLLAPLLGTDPDMKVGGPTETGTLVKFEIKQMWMLTGGRASMAGRELGSLTPCTYRHDMGAFQTMSKAMMTKLKLHFQE